MGQRSRNAAEGIKMDELSRTQILNLIDDWIHNSRDREILKRRWLDGIRYEPLAEEFDLSVRHVKRIVHDAQEKLAKHIPQ